MVSAPDLAGLIRYYETLTPASVAELGKWYAADATFQDPFNQVRGLQAVQRVFARMFEQVHAPRFAIGSVFHGEQAQDGVMLLWRFDFGLPLPGRVVPIHMEGSSHLGFATDGKVRTHRDYWDPAAELYGQVPLLGCLVRGFQRRVGA